MAHNFAKPYPISKKLVCWNQHEHFFYLLIKFEENLRWWFDCLGQLTWNGPQRKFVVVTGHTKEYISENNSPEDEFTMKKNE